MRVDLSEPTYDALRSACCEELDLPSDNVRIISISDKPPNILVRKDRDVERLKDEQVLEMEVTKS